MVLTSQPADAQQPAAPTPPVLTQPDKPDHFAVIVAAGLFVALLIVYVMELHWSASDPVALWLQAKMDMLLGAILMGLSPAAIAAAKALKGGQ